MGNKKNLIDAESHERFKARWADTTTREEMIAELLRYSEEVKVSTSRVWKKEEIERLGIEVIDVEWEEV